MNRMRRVALSYGWLFLFLLPTPATFGTAIDNYVAKPDPTYRYDLYHVDQTSIYTSYFIHLVSQQWRTAQEVDRPLWEHELQITIPTVVHSASPRTVLLIVNGGSNGGPLNTETGAGLSALATLSGSIVAMIDQVPNQPLYFADDAGQPRSEDAIIAYSLDKFLTTGDPEWPVQLPMTKAVVRAMDTIQDFLKGESIPVDDFIVLGGSKRGWATWLTAAVDRRVKAIVPISIDLLNMERQFTHHWEAYGFYSEAIQDYVDFDLPCRMRSSPGQELLQIIDPYSYRDRFQMPKMIINSAGDQFFLPDSSQFYFQNLPGPKDLRYTFNTDHAQGEDLQTLLDVALGTLSWISDVNGGQESPRFSWSFEPDGAIRVQTQDRPDAVYLAQATNPTARDFRLETIGAAWARTPLYDQGGGTYLGNVAPPAQGWTAYAVEIVYGTNPLTRQVYTTDVRIAPDLLPFQGTACSIL
jgi:PhoPQ-activated pathogenicity-related protein